MGMKEKIAKLKEEKKKKPETKMDRHKEVKLWHALISFGGLVAIMSVGIVVFHLQPHIPMFIGVIFAAIVSLLLGFKWSKLESMMIEGISKVMPAIIILAIVGMLVGVWILSGTIPTMIYYGLKLLSPSVFLVAAVLICSVTSLATGTSWGTMGTMGLALMGIGVGLGMPLGPTAGAIISGAYFGDKMSPLSDTTNLAPAMAGTDVFTHVKYMMKPTIIAYIITLLFFGIYGFLQDTTGEADITQINLLVNGIEKSFNINPILLLPPIIVIGAIILKIPAVPGITLGVIAAGILAPIFQTDLQVYNLDHVLNNVGVGFGDVLYAARDGFVSSTGVESLDSLLTTGGLMNMSSSILMAIIAMMFGGIMEGTGQLRVMIEALMKVVKGGPALVGTTEITCILSNIVMPEQYISILVPGRMFAPAYRKAGIHPKSLSNALESAGTVTSPLVPWNTCGMFIAATLMVEPFGENGYFQWCIFNLAMPVITLVLAYFKITLTKMTPEQQKFADEGKIVY